MKKIIFFVLIAVVILIATAIFYPKTSIDEVHSTNRYVWEGSSRSYDYTLSVQSDFNLNGNPIQNTIVITARINFNVFDIQNNIVKAGYSVSNISVLNDGKQDDRLADIYSLPMIVSIGESGKFLDFVFPKNATPVQQNTLLGFYAYLEAVVENSDQYVVSQEDGVGEYVADYTYGEALIHRSKSRYSQLKIVNNALHIAEPVVDASEFSFVPDPNGIWLKTLSGSESIRFMTDTGDVPVALNVEASLTPALSDQSVSFFDRLTYTEAVDKLDWGLNSRERAVQPVVQNDVVGDKLEKLSLLPTIKSMSDIPTVNDMIKMKRFLEGNAEGIQRIPDIIYNEDLSVMQKQLLLSVLGMIANDDAQRSLLTITSESKFHINDRLGAVMSVATLSRPLITDLESWLFEGLGSLEQNSNILDVSSSAVLAIGSIAEELKEHYPVESTALSEELSAALATADNYQKKYILLSLGNTHDSEHVETITAYLGDPDATLRLAAAESLAYMDGKAAEDKLAEAYASETESGVKLAVLKSLRNREKLDQHTVAAVIAEAENELQSNVRKEIVGVIADHIIDQPALKVTLEKMLKNEQSKDNIKEILKAAGKLRMHQQYQ